MDPISVTNRVQERTLDLQRTADQVHQERELRSTPAAESVTSNTRPAEARPSPAKAGGCSTVESAT
jgi:hypothetical protein